MTSDDDLARGAVTICPVCSSTAFDFVCEVTGQFSGKAFVLIRCPGCQFTCVQNPWLDFERIYDENYYSGRGADPLVNYVEEASHPGTTIRQYEWRGISERVRSLRELPQDARWLDYGCGTGGLVSHLLRQGLSNSVGFEQGWNLVRLRERNVPVLTQDELESQAGTFDVVTAIEVIEHTVDPVAELRRMRALLKNGGLLFLTTGNAGPFRNRMDRWSYVVPEVHISYFEPPTLARALEAAGFRPAFPGFGPGWPDIIRFKVLKSLKRRHASHLDGFVPWPLVARLIDRRLGVAGQPVGWAQDGAGGEPLGG